MVHSTAADYINTDYTYSGDCLGILGCTGGTVTNWADTNFTGPTGISRDETA